MDGDHPKSIKQLSMQLEEGAACKILSRSVVARNKRFLENEELLKFVEDEERVILKKLWKADEEKQKLYKQIEVDLDFYTLTFLSFHLDKISEYKIVR